MSGKKSILIVEGNIQYGEILHNAVTLCGHYSQLAFSATGGLDLARKRHFDLIIADTNMPSSNGFQLVEKLVKMCLAIPIVVLTEINDLNQVKKALRIGVSDYLIKPLKLEELPIVFEKNLVRAQTNLHKLYNGNSELLLKSLKALMRALAAKDPNTWSHSQQVAYLASLMGRELHLSAEEQYVLQLGAYLHDIGKIGIPDHILNKAETLQDTELNIAKDHPVIGSQIIGEISELAEVAAIVRHHHERYDGQGYPDGLQGDAIPFFSRILAIVDAYEALVSNRVYRKAVNCEEALDEIRRNSGKQFDPQLVNLFFAVIRHTSPSNGQVQSENPLRLAFC